MAHVNITLLGLLRLDIGLHYLEADADRIKDLYPILLEKAVELNPGTTVTAADIDGCIVLINGKQSKKSSKLSDGDEVHLMSPVCGG